MVSFVLNMADTLSWTRRCQSKPYLSLEDSVIRLAGGLQEAMANGFFRAQYG